VVRATTNGLNITCYLVCVYILCLSEEPGRTVGPDGLSHGTRGAPRIGAAMQARPRHHRYRHHQPPTAWLIPLLEQLVDRLQQPTPAVEPPPRETSDQAVQCNLLRPPPLPRPVPIQQVYPTGQGRGFNLLRVMNGYYRPPPPPGQVQPLRPPEPFVTQMQRLSIAPAYAANASQLLDLAPQPAHSDDEVWD
jgi:hypothetical protein